MNSKENKAPAAEQKEIPVPISPVITISQDKLSAFMEISNPNNYPWTMAELMGRLRDHGVVYGIMEGAVAGIMDTCTGSMQIAAVGTPPGQPVDERVELLFNETSSAPEDNSAEKVNYRERFSIPSVEPGTLLAVKHPGKPGDEGTAVTGHKIPPKEPAKVELRAGKGTKLCNEGLGVKSVISGRCWSQTWGRVTVVGIEPIYRHHGDVDIKTGNIRFKGNVEITGNVTDAMEVHVTETLRVAGFVSNAKIITGGDILVVKSVIGSNVRAGGIIAAYNSFEKVFEELLNQLKNMDQNINQLYAASDAFRDKGFGQLVMTLLDKKYHEVPKKVKQVQKLVFRYSVDLPEELVAAADVLKSLIGIKVLSLTSFKEVYTKLQASLEFIRQFKEHRANARINSIRNSVVEATGSIVVDGQGCLNSRLTAMGKIENRGVFRGGELYAREGITVNELGAPFGTVTVARVDSGSTIKARVVHVGTLLQVGNRKYEVLTTASSVKARLDGNGNIIL